MALQYDRWERLELSDDDEDGDAPKGMGDQLRAGQGEHSRRLRALHDAEFASQQKRPVREVLPQGSRSEEELLKEQQAFFLRTTDGTVRPAATLATRRSDPPVSEGVGRAAGTAKPMSKFALERQRKRESMGLAAAGNAMRSDGGGAGADSGRAIGMSDSGAAPRDQKTAPREQVRQREPPPKPVGEPMSVVNMTIVEKEARGVAPVAPSIRATPAPVAQHRSARSAAVANVAVYREDSGRGWGRPVGGGEGLPDLVASANDQDDWVSTRRADWRLHAARTEIESVARQAALDSSAADADTRERRVGGGMGDVDATDTSRRARGGQSQVGDGAALPSKAEIHEQNMQLLGKMTKGDIEQMRQELESQMDPALLEKMRARLAKSKQKQGAATGSARSGGSRARQGATAAAAAAPQSAPQTLARKGVSFEQEVVEDGDATSSAVLPRAVAQELHPDGLLCNLPPPTREDIAKMQWMGEVGAAGSDCDDQDGRDGGSAGAALGGQEASAARVEPSLASKTVETLRFDFSGRLVAPSRRGEGPPPSFAREMSARSVTKRLVGLCARHRHPAIYGACLQVGKVTAVARTPFLAGVSSSEGLHHHGDEPDQAGYTLPELMRLSRSAFSAQRTLALQTITEIVLQVAREGAPAQLLLQFLLENDVAVLARCALDDRNLSHMASAARLLSALVAASYVALPLEGEEGGAEEALWRRRHAGADTLVETCSAGWRGGWLRMLEGEVEEDWADVLGLRGNDLVVFESPAQARQAIARENARREASRQKAAQGLEASAQSLQEEEEADAPTVARTDPVRGLLAMRVLPKIAALLKAVRNVSVECSLLQVLLLVAQHSPTAAAAIYNCPTMLETMQEEYLGTRVVDACSDEDMSTESTERRARAAEADSFGNKGKTARARGFISCTPECRCRILVVRLLRVLALSDREICQALHRAGILEAAKQYLIVPYNCKPGKATSSLSDRVVSAAEIFMWEGEQLCLAAQVLACWRAALDMAVGAESLAHLSLRLQSFAGHIAGSIESVPPLCRAGDHATCSDSEKAQELAATCALRVAQTGLLLAAGGNHRGISWNQIMPWLSVAENVARAYIGSPCISSFLSGGARDVLGMGRGGRVKVKGLWVLAASLDFVATYIMTLETLIAREASGLSAARTMASHVCINLFLFGRISFANSPDEKVSEMWGVQVLKTLFDVSWARTDFTSESVNEEDRVEARAGQELALAMLRLLRSAAHLLMMTEDDAQRLRQRELDQQDEDKGKEAQGGTARTHGVLHLMDFCQAGLSWSDVRKNVLGVGGTREEGDAGCDTARALGVVNEMMEVVVDALPIATDSMRVMRRIQTRDPRYGRSTSMLHVEMVALSSYFCGGVWPLEDVPGRESSQALLERRRRDLIRSSFVLSRSLGPGDESLVMRLVDGVLLPHLCSPAALQRALTAPEIFRLGGMDSAAAAKAIRDLYLHWLKRLMSSEGDGVVPLSVATFTYNQPAILSLARPLKSAYLPLPDDFLFLPLSIALKAVTHSQDADDHLALPEFRRASCVVLSLIRILLTDSGKGLSIVLGRATSSRPGGEADDDGCEAIFCRVASVFLLGSDVYLDESVVPFLAGALRAIIPPSWVRCETHLEMKALGFDLSRKCLQDLEAGKLFTALASQLTQDSFGDSNLSYTLAVVLHTRLPAAWRNEVWDTLSPYYLNLVRCVPDGVPGGLSAFLWPPEDNLAMLHNYRIALSSGHISSDSNPFLYHLAVHHLSRYIFMPPPRAASTTRASSTMAARGQGSSSAHGALREGSKHLLRALISESPSSLYLSICSYIAPADGSLQQAGAECEKLACLMRGEKKIQFELPFGARMHDGEQSARQRERWDILVAVCAMHQDTLSKVRLDGGVLAQEAFLFLQRDRVC